MATIFGQHQVPLLVTHYARESSKVRKSHSEDRCLMFCTVYPNPKDSHPAHIPRNIPQDTLLGMLAYRQFSHLYFFWLCLTKNFVMTANILHFTDEKTESQGVVKSSQIMSVIRLVASLCNICCGYPTLPPSLLPFFSKFLLWLYHVTFSSHFHTAPYPIPSLPNPQHLSCPRMSGFGVANLQNIWKGALASLPAPHKLRPPDNCHCMGWEGVGEVRTPGSGARVPLLASLCLSFLLYKMHIKIVSMS